MSNLNIIDEAFATSNELRPDIQIEETGYKPKYNWPVLHRHHNRVPIAVGYIPLEHDELTLIPNPDTIKIMDEAMDMIANGATLRGTAAWLSKELKRNVSHQTIKMIFQRVTAGTDLILPKKPKPKKKKTNQQIAIEETRKKLHYLRVSQAAAVKRLESLTEDRSAKKIEEIEPQKIALEDPLEHLDTTNKEVIFKPNVGPQTDFLAASEQEVLYGGAAGGGKSYALLADPMRYFGDSRFNGLLVRRTNDELRELKWKSRELYSKAFPGAVWREKDSMWLFPSGAQFWMTYLERDDDVTRYQGQAFTYIAFDELTHWPTPFAWNYMRSRLRTADDGEENAMPVYMRATTNPGGVGHGWVKRMFIDPAPAGQAFDARDFETGEILRWPEGHENGKGGQPLFQRRFIPAKLIDNPYLYKSGQYEANLLSLSESARRQLLEGDWNVADGAAFPEFRNDIHTCAPFEIPDDWVRFRSCDYGYNSWSAVHWYAIDPSYETLIVYRELYVTKKTGTELSQLVRLAEQGERIQYGMLDSSVWHQRGQTGPSIAEEMIQAGTKWRPADRSAGSRANGKNRLHELLKTDPYTGKPGIIFFNTCRQIISDLPIIPADPDGLDDINVDYTSDHAYDSIRYGIMSRPRSRSPFSDWFGGNTAFNQRRPADRRFGY